MEKTLEKHMEEAFRIPGVAGVLCTDSNGLCLASRGNVPRQYSGSITALANHAAQLRPTINSADPVIFLESEYGTVLVKKTENITTAIFKSG